MCKVGDVITINNLADESFIVVDDNPGYIKGVPYYHLNKLFYINKDITDFKILGRISDDFLNKIMMLIVNLDKKGSIKLVMDKL